MGILMQNEKAIGGGVTLASELTAVDTEGIVGTAGAEVTGQALLDGLAEETKKNGFVIDCGSHTFDISTAGQYSVAISFNKTFVNPPVVVASISDPARGAGDVVKTAVGVYALSNTSVTFRVKTEEVMSGPLTITWIAVGN